MEYKKIIENDPITLVDSLFESNPTLMCIVDSDRRIIKANKKFRDTSGWPDSDTSSDLVCGGLGCLNTLSDPKGSGKNIECDLCDLKESLGDTILTGRPHNDIEFNACIIKDNETKDYSFLCKTSIIDMDSGKYIILSLTNISEAKRIQREIVDNEKKYYNILNSVKNMYFLHEVDEDFYPGNFIEVNNITSEVLGYSKDELLEMGPLDIIERNQRNQFKVNIANTWKNDGSIFERTMLTRSKKRIRVEIISHLVDINGENMVLCVARDLTERNRIRKHLLISENRYKNLVENYPDLVIRFNDKKKIDYCNRKITEMLKKKPNSCIDSSLEDIPLFNRNSKWWK